MAALVNIKRQHKHRFCLLSLSQISCSTSLWWRLGHGWNPSDTGPRESLAFLLLLVSEVHFNSVGLEMWEKIHTMWPQGRNWRAVWWGGIYGGGCECRKEEGCWDHQPSAPFLHIFFPLRGGIYVNIHEYNFFGLQQKQISFKLWPGPWWITFAFIYLKQMLTEQSPI